MASTLSFCSSPLHSNSSSKFQTFTNNPNYSLRIRILPKSSPHKTTIGTTNCAENSSQQQQIESKVINEGVEIRDHDPDSDSDPSSVLPFFNSVSNFLSRLRNGFSIDELGIEIMSIALPAALALASDPIASLVDTAFVGHLGSVELAAVGVSVSVFNLVSKLFNVPLLNITTSFVAEEQAMIRKGNDVAHEVGDDCRTVQQGKTINPSVSTSLALATGFGIAEAAVLSVGPSYLMNIMGIPADSPMRVPAEHFLFLRAFGAPPVVIALAAQGAFRGFKNTKTPLYAIGAGNLLNAILDPIFIFFFNFGVGGAAVAIVISEYFIALILLWELNKKVLLISPKFDGKRFVHYLQSGGLLVGRTIAVLVIMTLATSLAAREGPVPMAGHQICIEVWLALSLLTDALALAGQALLAADYSQGNYEQSRQVINRVIKIGLVTGSTLAVFLFVGFEGLSSLFTTDSEVLKIVHSGTLFVAISQPVNAIAFVLDGLYYGVSDFGYAAYSMVIVALISSAFMVLTAPMIGLAGVWGGLFLFMTLRVVAGAWRLGTRRGPWKLIWCESEFNKSE